MGTYAQLKSRVATELGRSDQTANIVNAVSRAIEFYAPQKFWFNQDRETATTTAANEYASVPSGLRLEDAVYVTIGSIRQKLFKRSFEEIEDMAMTASTGQPTDYAIYGSQVRLYPTPDAEYTLTFLGTFDLTALSGDSDTNAWTSEAQDLICARAKRTIYADILYDGEGEQAAAISETEAYRRLLAETNRRTGTGRMRSSE